MSDKIHFKKGERTNLSSVTNTTGQVLFAERSDTTTSNTTVSSVEVYLDDNNIRYPLRAKYALYDQNENLIDVSNYVTLDTEQTITGTKTFNDINRANIYSNINYMSLGYNSLLTLSRIAASTSGSTYTPEKWYIDKEIIPTDGLTIFIKMPSGGDWRNIYLSLNNGTNYYPIALNSTSVLTTHFPSGSTLLLTFEASSSVKAYALTGSSSTSSVTGIWRVVNYRDSDTYPAAISTTAAATQAKTAYESRYVLLDKSYVYVTMAYANTVQNKITLNINNQGAKDIYINGTVSSSSNYTLPRGTYLVYYQDSKYYFRTDGNLQQGITTIGSTTKPVYLNAGVITASNASIGTTTQPVYMTNGAFTASTATVGSASQPIYMSNGTITALTGAIANDITGNARTATKATQDGAGNVITDTYYLATNPSGYTTNTGTVTSVAIKMNGSVQGTITDSGTIDLGTVLTAHQSLRNYMPLSGGTFTGDVIAYSTNRTTSSLRNIEVRTSSYTGTLQSTDKIIMVRK